MCHKWIIIDPTKQSEEKLMKVVNLTPHEITVNSQVFPTSGIVARVETVEKELSKMINNMPIVSRTIGKVDFGMELPEPETVYLVSSMVLDAIPTDSSWVSVCFSPDTGKTAIRNDKGHIVSVTRLIGK